VKLPIYLGKFARLRRRRISRLKKRLLASRLKGYKKGLAFGTAEMDTLIREHKKAIQYLAIENRKTITSMEKKYTIEYAKITSRQRDTEELFAHWQHKIEKLESLSNDLEVLMSDANIDFDRTLKVLAFATEKTSEVIAKVQKNLKRHKQNTIPLPDLKNKRIVTSSPVTKRQ